MKTYMTLMVVSLLACATDPIPPTTSTDQSNVCVLEDGVWSGCGDTGTGGGGGGGGGTPASCETINCTQDWQCWAACTNTEAQCALVGDSGYCLNWQPS